MIYVGKTLTLSKDNLGIAELIFDRKDSSVNKLDSLTLHELHDAVGNLQQEQGVRGLLLRSAKPSFIVGADVTEFPDIFKLDSYALKAWLRQTHRTLNAIEQLPYPTVAAISGMALGGGFEVTLSCDYRLITEEGCVGLPELNFGIYPAWGGSVRLSRLVGIKNSLDWIVNARPEKAQTALEVGAVDRVVSAKDLVVQARHFLIDMIENDRDYLPMRTRKQLAVSQQENPQELFDRLSKMSEHKYGRHYPAPKVIIELIRSHSSLDFCKALELEIDSFPALANDSVAQSLIGLFLNDQLLKRQARKYVFDAVPVKKSALLGAGIMGGGIAFQSASTGTPILMKDINGKALEMGLQQADNLLSRLVDKGRISAEAKAQALSSIDLTLDYEDFVDIDLVAEAVVESAETKASVLAETEQQVSAEAVLTSNTSTISIDHLATFLQRPQNFCGMHFFNPVSRMPLVEIVRGAQSSDRTIATTVAYACSLGKTPIVVNDCPGFLVNRILFPYFNGFNRLLMDGVDFQRIDRVMESFGWPMGPAHLLDVVGIDTAVHADGVMASGFPKRMGHQHRTVIEALLTENRLGQKNRQGFYNYEVDKQGNRTKTAEDRVYEMIESMITSAPDFDSQSFADNEISDAEIVDRLMIPMCLEAVRCLEEGIAETAAEVDMGLVLGLGFPRFHGGPLRYIDNQGMQAFCALVEKYQHHGPLYQLTPGMNIDPQRQFFD
ncbi:fatty acid oxidation complex subunit alpha FadB [Motiliproteus sp. MSK22-1]|uniref:fatty acid oxidation complex subunit alpha FadB n=1 Tax=Motiliproteus sp. MSK22-1 TaxID=1897630 RepID=UPI0009777EB1|nr:fatty acid oxidation complex subunit alpha FadB [Motiliproteus sp. MSK22-1]OMH25722.1 multifunctional fatty acid oxidation complex subunit alpha [Motiliproteus sp. MSK22-1]